MDSFLSKVLEAIEEKNFVKNQFNGVTIFNCVYKKVQYSFEMSMASYMDTMTFFKESEIEFVESQDISSKFGPTMDTIEKVYLIKFERVEWKMKMISIRKFWVV